MDSVAVNYVDERNQGKSASAAPRPLISLRTSPPRVVKRKSQAAPPAPGSAIPRPKSPCPPNQRNPNILSVENLPGSNFTSRQRSPGRIPDVAIIPMTPEAKSKNSDGQSRFIRIEPRSPRVSAANKSPRRGGGWL